MSQTLSEQNRQISVAEIVRHGEKLILPACRSSRRLT